MDRNFSVITFQLQHHMSAPYVYSGESSHTHTHTHTHAHTHTHTRARARARTHARTHARLQQQQQNQRILHVCVQRCMPINMETQISSKTHTLYTLVTMHTMFLVFHTCLLMLLDLTPRVERHMREQNKKPGRIQML